jgi:hypothetical protein
MLCYVIRQLSVRPARKFPYIIAVAEANDGAMRPSQHKVWLPRALSYGGEGLRNASQKCSLTGPCRMRFKREPRLTYRFRFGGFLLLI